MHARMDRAERAKQFMPFNPLRGFQEALREKEKVVVERAELSEEEGELLDWKLHALAVGDMVETVYYDHGEYVKVTGLVSRIDPSARVLKVVNTKIPFEDMVELEFCD